MKHILVIAAATLAMAGGCISNADVVGKVRPRAAFDLSCPEQQVDVKFLNGDPGGFASYGASGCGKRARYETHCQTGSGPQSCDIRTQSIDGEVKPAPTPAP